MKEFEDLGFAVQEGPTDAHVKKLNDKVRTLKEFRLSCSAWLVGSHPLEYNAEKDPGALSRFILQAWCGRLEMNAAVTSEACGDTCAGYL